MWALRIPWWSSGQDSATLTAVTHGPGLISVRGTMILGSMAKKKKKGMWALMCTPVFETQLLLLPGSITLSKLFIISELSFPYLYTGDSSA